MGPAALVDTEIAPDLLRTLSVESAEGHDTLPLLQHALMRLCEMRERTIGGSWQITSAHYKTLGGMGQALNDHADDVLRELSPEQKDLAKKIFQQLTEVAQGRDQRRPMRLSQLVERTEAARPNVEEVVKHFLTAYFLTSPDRERVLDWEVDISHESLIRQWRTLSDWANEEAQEGDDYLYFAKRAERRGELLTGADLAIALEWRDRKRNRAWAERYGGDFSDTVDFIERSRKAKDERRLWRRIIPLSVLGMFLLAGFGGALAYYWKERQTALEAEVNAKLASQKAKLQLGEAAARNMTNEGTRLARLGNFGGALKQFQKASDANLTLPIEVLDQSITDAQHTSDPALNNLTVARQNYLDYLASQGLAVARTGDTGKAFNYFKALSRNPMFPIEILDRAISDAQSKKDNALPNFEVTRQAFMNDTDPFSQADLKYRDYACQHSAFVIAASEPESKVEEEVKRWQQMYPTASGGIAGPNSPQVQIIAASFLTCEQARNLRDELNRKKLSTGAFIGNEYSQCSACSYHAP